MLEEAYYLARIERSAHLSRGTADYFNRVKAGDPAISNYFRHFQAPGVQHCAGGLGAFPVSTFDSLIQWVEKGVAPEVLEGVSLPLNGTVLRRNLCSYPEIQVYKTGHPTIASSFECVQPKGKGYL